jgi:putative ABC transport system permease protein
MTRHLIRLIWNRKRQNLLLAVEILCSFLVLFFVVFLALHFGVNARKPLGFGIDRVWNVDVGRPRELPGSRDGDAAAAQEKAGTRARERDNIRRLIAAARELPQIEIAAASYTAPYANSTWGSGMDFTDGRHFEFRYNGVTDDFLRLLSMPMIAGRGFTREDDGAAADPVLLNASLAREMFGDPSSAVGQVLPEKIDPNQKREPTDPPVRPKRVVGVFEEFRQHGEYSVAWPVMFDRMRIDGDAGPVPDRLLIRVRPGTTATFEPVLVRRLQREAPDWSFEVSTLDHLRDKKLSDYTMPLSLLAVVAGFLLLMVALGLTGVVWQSVTQRLREFGLRRAAGAAGAAVRRQVLAEMAVMTTFALLAGVALLAQVPLLPLPREMAFSPVVFAGAVAISAGAIYCLTLACGWYPSRLATRIPPAEALRYE